MPIHDWTRTYAGAFHHFHGAWIFEIARALNGGVLPEGYYALGEQVVGGAVPDVLALEQRDFQGSLWTAGKERPHAASPGASPRAARATITAVAEDPRFPPRPRVIAVRHVSGDRLVALMEIVSAGNKSDAAELGSLVEKTLVTLSRGIHVLLIDLHPPGSLDPQGVHNMIWSELGQDPMPMPSERPLLIASYLSGHGVESYIEPRAVGETLPEMPLFLRKDLHVLVPLERTYQTAFDSLPLHLRTKLS